MCWNFGMKFQHILVTFEVTATAITSRIWMVEFTSLLQIFEEMGFAWEPYLEILWVKKILPISIRSHLNTFLMKTLPLVETFYEFFFTIFLWMQPLQDRVCMMPGAEVPHALLSLPSGHTHTNSNEWNYGPSIALSFAAFSSIATVKKSSFHSMCTKVDVFEKAINISGKCFSEFSQFWFFIHILWELRWCGH